MNTNQETTAMPAKTKDHLAVRRALILMFLFLDTLVGGVATALTIVFTPSASTLRGATLVLFLLTLVSAGAFLAYRAASDPARHHRFTNQEILR